MPNLKYVIDDEGPLHNDQLSSLLNSLSDETMLVVPCTLLNPESIKNNFDILKLNEEIEKIKKTEPDEGLAFAMIESACDIAGIDPIFLFTDDTPKNIFAPLEEAITQADKQNKHLILPYNLGGHYALLHIDFTVNEKVSYQIIDPVKTTIDDDYFLKPTIENLLNNNTKRLMICSNELQKRLQPDSDGDNCGIYLALYLVTIRALGSQCTMQSAIRLVEDLCDTSKTGFSIKKLRTDLRSIHSGKSTLSTTEDAQALIDAQITTTAQPTESHRESVPLDPVKIHFVKQQPANASTAISLLTIEAITQADSQSTTPKIRSVIRNAMKKYEIFANSGNGQFESMSASDAQKQFKLNVSVGQPEDILKAPDANDIELFINQRRTSRETGAGLDYLFESSNDLIMSLSCGFGIDPFDLVNMPDEQLKNTLNSNNNTNQESMKDTLVSHIQALNTSHGCLITYDINTISITRMGQAYYCFDPATGQLYEASSAEQLVDFLYTNKASLDTAQTVTIRSIDASTHQHSHTQELGNHGLFALNENQAHLQQPDRAGSPTDNFYSRR